MIPLSLLDLAFVTTGTPPSAALRNSIDLARHADRLGYRRYWIAEHHNLPSVAIAAPDILIGQIAAVTQNIRVGSGGVMLPNHAPLVVAERFRTLEALFPGRIDLGIGRAPGTDGVTAVALRRRQDRRDGDDFLERLQELVLWETGGWPANHPFGNVVAMPSDAHLPPLYLLGSSDYSAELAARIGMGFAFAHHFATYDAVAAMRSYRDKFQPSGWRERPLAILAIAAVCADTEAESERLASSMDLNWLRRSYGEYHVLPSPEEAAAYPYAEADRVRMRKSRERLFVGTPDMIEARLMPLVEATQADEVMITSAIYDHAARKRSYELIAGHFMAGARVATSA
ncbi:MAG: LLM class flavin-dependent oxidoreductase [Methylobacteriaceae bacterium]|nr:LLM class flavin-dependent oxidoreductase [Methylobacteriaceae bacterium]MBV9395171.1 LLM class flavin-dependent oxidoreductase [Methylobacteriaceae bacterium]